jgi:hypothetical protein
MKAIEIKANILERFKPYLQEGALDFSNNLSYQIDQYALAVLNDLKKEIDIDGREINEIWEDKRGIYASSPADEFKKGMREMRAIGVSAVNKQIFLLSKPLTPPL